MSSNEKRDKIAAKSRICGQTIGRLMYRQNPGWSKSRFVTFVQGHSNVPGMLMVQYKRGIAEGFLQARREKLISYSTGYDDLPSIEEAIRTYEMEVDKQNGITGTDQERKPSRLDQKPNTVRRGRSFHDTFS